MTSETWKVISGAALAAVLTTTTPAQADTIDLSLGTNPWTFGGVTVTAKAYGYKGGQFVDSSLGQWTMGLGNCFDESCTGNDRHQIDNADAGEDEWILLLFSQPVNVSGARINTTNASDTDMSWLAGLSGFSPIQNLDLDPSGTVNDWDYSDVLALANFQQGFDAPAGKQGSRDVAFNASGINFLLLGAFTGANDTFCSATYSSGPKQGQCKTWSPAVDMFKFETVTYTRPPVRDPLPTPEPASLLLLGAGLVGIRRMARNRRS